MLLLLLLGMGKNGGVRGGHQVLGGCGGVRGSER